MFALAVNQRELRVAKQTTKHYNLRNSVQRTGVQGVLLFIKALHSLKLIVYLNLNKSFRREKIVSCIYRTL